MRPSGSSYVTIVSGLPRSGTSLMMQMLALAGQSTLTDRTRPADDDNPAGYYEFEPVKHIQHDDAWVNEAIGQTVKVIYFLLYDLPTDVSYRVIFMRRRLEEVAASQAAMLQRRGERGAGCSQQELIALFRRQLAKLDRWASEQTHIEWLDVDFNRLLKDPQPTIAAIEEFLGDGLKHRAMARAIDPALYRQRS